MIARRTTSFLLGLLLLNLTWVESDSSCVDHPQADAATASMHDAMAHHEMHGATSEKPHDSSPDLPATPRCCASLASCAVAWNAARLSEPGDVPPAGAGIPGRSLRMPLTGIQAPDPPPPKA